jgi:hypothetical protein
MLRHNVALFSFHLLHYFGSLYRSQVNATSKLVPAVTDRNLAALQDCLLKGAYVEARNRVRSFVKAHAQRNYHFRVT